MSEITFVVTDEAIEVVECFVHGARLAYIADGLKIWIEGSSKYHHPDCFTNLAMQACEARHIPLITLRQQGGVRRSKSFDTNTKRMF